MRTVWQPDIAHRPVSSIGRPLDCGADSWVEQVTFGVIDHEILSTVIRTGTLP